MPPRHRFLEPIHNVKVRGEPLASARALSPREDLVFIPGENVRASPRAVSRGKAAPYGALRPAGRPCSRCELADANSSPLLRWWSQPGSNRRPQACKASALPTELWPHRPIRMVRMFPFAMGGGEPVARRSRVAMVGLVGVEPTTSRLSGVRSNHLSYRPMLLVASSAGGSIRCLGNPRMSSGARSRLRP